MNTSKAKKTGAKEQPQEREYIEIRSHEVSNVRVIESKNGDLVFFTLKLNGVTIYNCRVATGKNGDFVSFPQYKGSDGKYYKHAYVKLSDADVDNISKQIEALL